jgi:hypothetical protein
MTKLLWVGSVEVIDPVIICSEMQLGTGPAAANDGTNNTAEKATAIAQHRTASTGEFRLASDATAVIFALARSVSGGAIPGYTGRKKHWSSVQEASRLCVVGVPGPP